MSAHVPDENDKLKAGTLPDDPRSGARPVNDAAKRQAEAAPRVLRVDELLADAHRRALAKRDPNERCTTGIHWLDNVTGGFAAGDHWVLGAQTNWGKSSLAVMIADENIRRHKRVLIVSVEDSEGIYGDRLMCRRARVSAMRMRDGCLTADERHRVTEVYSKAERVPVYLDARRKEHRRAEWVAEQVDRLIREESIDLVIYDYLQEFESRKRFQDERVKFKDVAATLRSATKAHNKPSVLLSQITEVQGKKVPDKNSIRECRDVSNAAEVVVLGFTPTDGDHKGVKCLFVDKVKQGPTGIVRAVDWDAESACFGARPGYGDADPEDYGNDFEEGI